MNNNLQIVAILNKKYAMSQEDAEKLFPFLENAIVTQQQTDLSFEDIENCSSIFLNNLLGKLYLSFGEKVDKFIHFTGIDSDDLVLPNQLERLRRRALNPEVYQPIFYNAIGQA